MKRSLLRRLSLLLLLVLPLAACGTTNLVRWGTDHDSIYAEPDSEFERGMLKPFVTIVGLPVAFAWDVVTFPFQITFQVYPYGGRFMQPDEVDDV